jgi:phosphatidate cytidylyltransferase
MRRANGDSGDCHKTKHLKPDQRRERTVARRKQMFWKRVASAAILIPIVGAAVYLGRLWLCVLVLLVGLAATFEYLHMLKTHGQAVSYVWGGALAAVLILDGQWPQIGGLSWGLALLPMLALVSKVFTGNSSGSLNGWALTVAGAVYVGWPVSHVLRLRQLDDGLYWLIIALLCTWICDTAAYAAGKLWGQHKFFPAISPKKTREGAIGGLLGGLLAAVGLARWLVGLGVGWGLLLGLLIVGAATFGDLAESVIKRQVGVKDSGHLIPGHGGMLDRIDSLLFVVPVVYYFASIISLV